MTANSRGYITKRITIDAVLIALFFVLSAASIRIGNTFKITFDSLACLLGAMVFGPLDAFLIGFLGEFMAQMLTYGFTPTTLLWMLAPASRGLILGLAVVIFHRYMSCDALFRTKRPYVYYAATILAAVVNSLLNTFALYVDSTLNHYYTYYLIYGALLARVGMNVVSSILIATVSLPLLYALKKTRFVPLR